MSVTAMTATVCPGVIRLPCLMQDEESGYEVPRKSLRHEDQSRSWHSATACLAQLSLLDNERHVSFGKATLLGPGRLG